MENGLKNMENGLKNTKDLTALPVERLLHQLLDANTSPAPGSSQLPAERYSRLGWPYDSFSDSTPDQLKILTDPRLYRFVYYRDLLQGLGIDFATIPDTYILDSVEAEEGGPLPLRLLDLSPLLEAFHGRLLRLFEERNVDPLKSPLSVTLDDQVTITATYIPADDELRALAAELDVSEEAIFTGWLLSEQDPSFYNGTKVPSPLDYQAHKRRLLLNGVDHISDLHSDDKDFVERLLKAARRLFLMENVSSQRSINP